MKLAIWTFVLVVHIISLEATPPAIPKKGANLKSTDQLPDTKLRPNHDRLVNRQKSTKPQRDSARPIASAQIQKRHLDDEFDIRCEDDSGYSGRNPHYDHRYGDYQLPNHRARSDSLAGEYQTRVDRSTIPLFRARMKAYVDGHALDVAGNERGFLGNIHGHFRGSPGNNQQGDDPPGLKKSVRITNFASGVNDMLPGTARHKVVKNDLKHGANIPRHDSNDKMRLNSEVREQPFDEPQERPFDQMGKRQIDFVRGTQFGPMQGPRFGEMQRNFFGSGFTGVQGNPFSQMRGQEFSEMQGNLFGQMRGPGFREMQGNSFGEIRGLGFREIQGNSFGQIRGPGLRQMEDNTFRQMPRNPIGNTHGGSFGQMHANPFSQTQENSNNQGHSNNQERPYSEGHSNNQERPHSQGHSNYQERPYSEGHSNNQERPHSEGHSNNQERPHSQGHSNNQERPHNGGHSNNQGHHQGQGNYVSQHQGQHQHQSHSYHKEREHDQYGQTKSNHQALLGDYNRKPEIANPQGHAYNEGNKQNIISGYSGTPERHQGQGNFFSQSQGQPHGYHKEHLHEHLQVHNHNQFRENIKGPEEVHLHKKNSYSLLSHRKPSDLSDDHFIVVPKSKVPHDLKKILSNVLEREYKHVSGYSSDGTHQGTNYDPLSDAVFIVEKDDLKLKKPYIKLDKSSSDKHVDTITNDKPYMESPKTNFQHGDKYDGVKHLGDSVDKRPEVTQHKYESGITNIVHNIVPALGKGQHVVEQAKPTVGHGEISKDNDYKNKDAGVYSSGTDQAKSQYGNDAGERGITYQNVVEQVKPTVGHIEVPRDNDYDNKNKASSTYSSTDQSKGADAGQSGIVYKNVVKQIKPIVRHAEVPKDFGYENKNKAAGVYSSNDQSKDHYSIDAGQSGTAYQNVDKHVKPSVGHIEISKYIANDDKNKASGAYSSTDKFKSQNSIDASQSEIGSQNAYKNAESYSTIISAPSYQANTSPNAYSNGDKSVHYEQQVHSIAGDSIQPHISDLKAPYDVTTSLNMPGGNGVNYLVAPLSGGYEYEQVNIDGKSYVSVSARWPKVQYSYGYAI